MRIELKGSPEVNTALAESIRLKIAQNIIDDQAAQIARLKRTNQHLMERLWASNQAELNRIIPSDPVEAFRAQHPILALFIEPIGDEL